MADIICVWETVNLPHSWNVSDASDGGGKEVRPYPVTSPAWSSNHSKIARRRDERFP